jgi:hypothetical protein
MLGMKKLLLLLALAIPALADVSGTWQVEGEVAGYPVSATCDMKTNENKLKGNCKIEGRGDADITGAVDGDTVTWQMDVEANGQVFRLVFTGKMDSETSIKGSIEVADMEGSFTAKKQP